MAGFDRVRSDHRQKDWVRFGGPVLFFLEIQNVSKERTIMDTSTEQLPCGVWIASARLGNPDDVETLLRPLPADLAAEVRSTLLGLETPKGARVGMRYDAPSSRAYFLQKHPGHLDCITFDRIKDLEQAAEIWAEIDDGVDYREAYSKVTGFNLSYVQ